MSLVSEEHRKTYREGTRALERAVSNDETRLAFQAAMTPATVGRIDANAGEAFSHLYLDEEGGAEAIGVYAKHVKGKPVVLLIGSADEGVQIDTVNEALGTINGLPPILRAKSPQEAAQLLRSELRFTHLIYRTPSSIEATLDSVAQSFHQVFIQPMTELKRFFSAAGLTEIMTLTRNLARHLAQMA